MEGLAVAFVEVEFHFFPQNVFQNHADADTVFCSPSVTQRVLVLPFATIEMYTTLRNREILRHDARAALSEFTKCFFFLNS